MSPGPFSTGIGSPVSIDSSTLERPSSTTPSTGTFSPGRTRSRSPTCTCVERDVLLVAAVVRGCAARSCGARRSSALIAAEVGERARSSSIWPSSVSDTMTAAASKYTPTGRARGRTPGNASGADGRDHAVERTPRRRRCRSASTCSGCGSRSTAPSARRTASRPTARPASRAPARASCATVRSERSRRGARTSRAPARRPSAAASTRSGAGNRPAPGSRRRRALGIIGSSAMPQIGQVPGASRTISGCIGQVYRDARLDSRRCTSARAGADRDGGRCGRAGRSRRGLPAQCVEDRAVLGSAMARASGNQLAQTVTNAREFRRSVARHPRAVRSRAGEPARRSGSHSAQEAFDLLQREPKRLRRGVRTAGVAVPLHRSAGSPTPNGPWAEQSDALVISYRGPIGTPVRFARSPMPRWSWAYLRCRRSLNPGLRVQSQVSRLGPRRAGFRNQPGSP